MYVMSGNGQRPQSHSQNSAATFTVFGYICMYVTAVMHTSLQSYVLMYLRTYVRRCVPYVRSNLSITSPLKATETVYYVRVFTTSGCLLHQGVHSSRCSLRQGVHYIRVFTTSGCSLHQDVHYIRVHLQ